MKNNKSEQPERTGKIMLMGVSYDDATNKYLVDLAKGSNVAETAFAMSIVIKCLVRDKIVEKAEDVTNLILKYLDDPQYSEVR